MWSSQFQQPSTGTTHAYHRKRLFRVASCERIQRSYYSPIPFTSRNCGVAERLPYVEHTCYVPSRIHPTFASDCLEYVRLLECCCHASLLPLMKKKMHNASDALRLSHYLLPILLISRWLLLRSTLSVQ
ncbi:hypothetical protein J6590_039063 [Homalodisca vitripennis]|nr:hypothetical protein J6590_039063 [Homalodisca vitripennis]